MFQSQSIKTSQRNLRKLTFLRYQTLKLLPNLMRLTKMGRRPISLKSSHSLRSMTNTSQSFVLWIFFRMMLKKTRAKLEKHATLTWLNSCTKLSKCIACISKAKVLFLLLKLTPKYQSDQATRLKPAINPLDHSSRQRINDFTELKRIKQSGRQRSS